METDHDRHRRPTSLPSVALIVLAGYVLSSGPVMAIAFWLRDKTGWDSFYAAMWLYYPLLILANNTPVERYFLWWTDLLGTSFPG